MNAEERDRSIIRTLEDSQTDLLEAVKDEADTRHDALRVWQAKMERRYTRVSAALIVMVVAAIVTGIVGGILYSAQASKVDQQASTISAQADRIAQLVRDQQAQVEANTRTATLTNAALCALRHDVEIRIAQTMDYLARHPEGIAGLPAKTLQATLANSQRTVAALGGLVCGRGANP